RWRSRAWPRSGSWARIPPGTEVAKLRSAPERRGVSSGGTMAHQVLVLNASYEPINVCSLQRAVVLLLKEKAEVLEQSHLRIRTASSSFRQPRGIRRV